MKKVKARWLVVIALILLFAIAASVQAGPPGEANGRWHYQFEQDLSVKGAGCNTFYHMTEFGQWSGTFNGDSHDEGMFVEHCSGDLSFNAIVSIAEASVDGQEGSLTLSVVGRWPRDADQWSGSWVVVDAGGDLANLHGQGTWWGSGDPDPEHAENWGYVDYKGSYHFSGR